MDNSQNVARDVSNGLIRTWRVYVKDTALGGKCSSCYIIVFFHRSFRFSNHSLSFRTRWKGCAIPAAAHPCTRSMVIGLGMAAARFVCSTFAGVATGAATVANDGNNNIIYVWMECLYLRRSGVEGGRGEGKNDETIVERDEKQDRWSRRPCGTPDVIITHW